MIIASGYILSEFSQVSQTAVILVVVALVPILLWVGSGVSPATLTAVTLALICWGCTWLARRRDPQKTAPTALFTTSSGRIVFVLSAALVQWFAITLGGEKALLWAMGLVTLTLAVWVTANTPASFTRRIQQLLLSAGTLFLCLVAAELYVRAVLAQRPPNDMRTVTWGHEVENNSLGFRDREFTKEKPDDTYRVMVLGDSLTWGAGLAVEDRYTNRMERLLGERFHEPNVEVLNFGIPGGPTVVERDILARHAVDVDPDLIVVGFGTNDPQTKDANYAVELDRYRVVFALIHDLGRVGFPRVSGNLRSKVDRFLRGAASCRPGANRWLEFTSRNLPNGGNSRMP